MATLAMMPKTWMEEFSQNRLLYHKFHLLFIKQAPKTDALTVTTPVGISNTKKYKDTISISVF